MKKNVASQVVGVQMITAADGSAFTGSVTALVTVDGGTQSASGGTGPTHEGNGFHTYLPTQAETNGDHIGFTFTGSGAIPTSVQVYTNFPQTVDNNVLAAGATGFAAIDTVVDAILVDTNELQTDWTNGGRLDLLLDAIPTTAMRGTDNAALASVCTEGRLAELDAANLPADLDLVLADTAELQGDWADGGRLDLILDERMAEASIDTSSGAVDNVTLVATTTAVTNEVTADITKISGSATAADNLEASALSILPGIVTGTPTSTEVAATALSTSSDDVLIGRIIIFTSGNAKYEAARITDYNATGDVMTVTELAVTPAADDTFVIV